MPGRTGGLHRSVHFSLSSRVDTALHRKRKSLSSFGRNDIRCYEAGGDVAAATGVDSTIHTDFYSSGSASNSDLSSRLIVRLRLLEAGVRHDLNDVWCGGGVGPLHAYERVAP